MWWWWYLLLLFIYLFIFNQDVLKPIELIPLPPILVSAKDDKSENALLRSRIDEQSQLIMILKRRSDDAVLANRSLEKVKQELEKLKISSAEETEAANKKYNMLESRFADLASNHEEMIQVLFCFYCFVKLFQLKILQVKLYILFILLFLFLIFCARV